MSKVVVVVVVVGCVLGCTFGCGRVIGDPNDKPPTAVAGDDVTALVGALVTLDGSGSDDDGGVTDFAWDFGDGGSASEATPSHAWSAAGGYVATLTVTDELGQSASDTLVVTINDDVPIARIVVAPAAGGIGDTLSFDASTSSGPALITGASWRFGDGSTADTALATHVYAAAGTFTVRLTVTDAEGSTGEAAVDVVISPADVTGVWDVVAPAFACASYSVQFPDAILSLTQAGVVVTASGGNGRSYTGSFTADGLPLRGEATIDTGACGAAVVDVDWRASLTAPGTLSGRATAFFDLAVGCQCTAAWTLTATRR
ncbi:MAG: PKD domain-containing protein [Deltaproteobacteria bacterium]|nr:PKD domain-containing protein [Deltaproteobacteria bacterium]